MSANRLIKTAQEPFLPGAHRRGAQPIGARLHGWDDAGRRGGAGGQGAWLRAGTVGGSGHTALAVRHSARPSTLRTRAATS